MESKEYAEIIPGVETYEIHDLEIFRAGEWNGDEYTEKDLDDIVSSFTVLGDKVKPYLKLGHDGKQKLLQKDGLPSAGWVTELSRKGKSLLAKIVNVPKKIKELIDAKAYGRISSEIFWNLKEGEKNYPRVLKAVALLGGDTPAIGQLDDFIKLYNENDYEMIKEYIISNEDIKMDDIKTYEREYIEAQATIKNYELEIAKSKEYTTKLEEQLKKSELDRKSIEVNSFLDGAVKEGRLTPAMKEHYYSLAMNGEQFEIVKKIVDGMEKAKEFSTQSQAVTPETKVDISDPAELSKDIDKRAMEYMLKNNLQDNSHNYKFALSQVVKEVK